MGCLGPGYPSPLKSGPDQHKNKIQEKYTAQTYIKHKTVKQKQEENIRQINTLCCLYTSTRCLQKFPTFKLSVTLSDL